MVDIASQRAFYDERWQDVEFANRLKLSRCLAILQGIASTRLLHPRMIDLGCGNGWLASIAGQFGPTLGVDLSQAGVERASRRYDHVAFEASDLFEWKHPSGAFDIVISQEVIEHVEDQRRYLLIARELLRERGYLILTTPNKRTLMAMPDEQRREWTNQPIENWLTYRELKSLLIPYFEICQFHSIVPRYGRRGLYRFVNSERLQATVESLRLYGVFDALRLAAGFGLHWFVLARKK